MAVFIWTPDFGAQEERKPRARKVRFGDGYSQRSADGMNADLAKWSMTFSNRTVGESGAIRAFLSARGGVENFDWTPPGGVAGKYTCETWTASPPNYGAVTVTAIFEEVPEP